MRPTLDILFGNFIFDYTDFAGAAFIKQFGNKNEYELIFEKFKGKGNFVIYLRQKLDDGKYKFLLPRLCVETAKDYNIYNANTNSLITLKDANFDITTLKKINKLYYNSNDIYCSVFIDFELFAQFFLKQISEIFFSFKFGESYSYELAFEILIFNNNANIALYKNQELMIEKVPVKLIATHHISLL